MDGHLENLMTVYLSQVSSAMKIADILSMHGGEEVISEDNIIISMIYRLMNSMPEEELNKSLEDTKKAINKIKEEDYEEEEELEEELEVNEKYRYVKKNNCNCDICAKARADLINYKTYEPIDELTAIYKRAIDNACERGKLIIK